MQPRLIGLDIIRSFAILFVLMSHGIGIIYETLPEFVGNYLMMYGELGVYLFFVLSGFLIGRIFIRDVFNNDHWRLKDTMHFWKRRWFRTLPNYYIFLAIYILLWASGVQKELPDPSHANFGIEAHRSVFGHFLFAQNLFTRNSIFFAQSWSLAVEEWFYLLLPILFFIGLRLLKVSSPVKTLTFTIFLFLLLVAVQLIAISFNIYDRLIVIYNLDKILAGVALAVGYEYFPQYKKSYKKGALILSMSLWLLVNFLLIKFVLVAKPNEVIHVLCSVGISVCFVAIIHYMTTFQLRIRLIGEWFRIISLASYSMYLMHILILSFVFDNFLLQMPFIQESILLRWICFIVYFIVTIILSYLVYCKVEKPLMELRDVHWRQWFVKKNNIAV